MRILAFFLLALAVPAATWDGAKGTITVSTQGDGLTTIVAVSSIDPAVSMFQVSALCDCVGRRSIQIIPATVSPKLGPRSSFAVFDIPETAIYGVSVIALKATEVQQFGSIR